MQDTKKMMKKKKRANVCCLLSSSGIRERKKLTDKIIKVNNIKTL